MMFDTDSFPLYVDNCASSSVTNSLSDFIKAPRKSDKVIQGINGMVNAIQVGTVQWHILDDFGEKHTLILPNTYYVPHSPHRLLSPQHWAQVAKDDFPRKDGTWSATYRDSIVMYWNQGKNKRTVPLHPESNVGMFHTAPSIQSFVQMCCSTVASKPQVDSPTTINLTDPEDIQLAENEAPPDTVNNEEPPVDIGLPMQTDWKAAESQEIQDPIHPVFDDLTTELLHWHYRLGHLSFPRLKQMAKLGIIPTYLFDAPITICSSCKHGKSKRRPWRTKGKEIRKIYKQDIKRPGECVSVDQLESSVPGLIGQLKGLLTKRRYQVATIFVDHFSSLDYPVLQQTTSSAETVAGKESFELHASSFGVMIRHYHCDNGRFADNLFRDSCLRCNQTISYSGVGIHSQNGKAEKRIQDLQNAATTMLLHAERQWPMAINTHLWPYALRMASDVYNHAPRLGNDASPVELFTGIKMRPLVQRFHHFGCPTFVLLSDLQSGKKGRKWNNRARVGIYLGRSTQHATSVSLVLSMDTGLVSPQFHCSFDDMFETTREAQIHLMPTSKWQTKCHFVPARDTTRLMRPTVPAFNPTNEMEANEEMYSGEIPQEDLQLRELDIEPDPDGTTEQVEIRTSMRERRRPAHLDDYHVAYESIARSDVLAQECMHPLVYKASTDPDIMYYHQAMQQPDREQWKKAVERELSDHEKGKHWVAVLISSLPKGTKVLPAVWAMRRKRRIATQEVYKWKARLNIDGGKQEHGIHYWETYAPVVGWPIVRFFLVLSLLKGWKTRQIDFVLAYTQADVETDLYMKLPTAYNKPGITPQTHVLKLLKNLYGQKQAGRVWNKYMTERTIALGFVQSKAEECVFYFKNSVMLVYTDDCIIMGPTDKELDIMVAKLKSSFDITEEGDICDYLGIKFTNGEDNTISLTQPHLIASILKDLGLDKPNSKKEDTPALSSKPLEKHLDRRSHDQNHFDYRSVIGKLNYLEKSTRPDISEAVHQCARFSSNPRQPHTEAVKRIGKYLQGTPDGGIIMRPGNVQSFECWVDASHAGEWKTEGVEDESASARSRMGYVFTYANCPILWASKMQTEIALSTTEAEYMALSMAMREMVPLVRLFEEAKLQGIDIDVNKAIVKCTVFEDNEGAAEIATVHKFRARTKHIHLKYHHFREHVTSGLIKIEKVPTTKQLADIFTKPLGIYLFLKFRLGIMGW